MITEDEAEGEKHEEDELVTEDETTVVKKEDDDEPKESGGAVAVATEDKSADKEKVAVKKEDEAEDGEKTNGDNDHDKKSSAVKAEDDSLTKPRWQLKPKEYIKLICVHCEIPIRTFNVSKLNIKLNHSYVILNQQYFHSITLNIC